MPLTTKKTFYRFILDGDTKNYNRHGNDAYISKNNIKNISNKSVIDLSHFVINGYNYYFCNSNNKINAYTNTGVLYYTTEETFNNITSMILDANNNIYIKHDSNKITCIKILANILEIDWSIEDDDFGDTVATDNIFIYVNSVNNKNKIYVINPKLINNINYIDREINITGFSAEYDSNEHKILKYMHCYNNYMFFLYGTDNNTSSSYICKLDLNNDEVIFNVDVSNEESIMTSNNIYTVDNIIYFAKHNRLYKMKLDSIISELQIFDEESNIIKIDKIDDDKLFVISNDNKVAIILIDDICNHIGDIIFIHDDSENINNVLLDVQIDKKDKNFYFIYSNSIKKCMPALQLNYMGIIGSPCYEFDGGDSFIEFNSMNMQSNNFSFSASFKPTKINNNKSVLFGGYDNYNWSSICWSEHLSKFCAITKNDNITSVMPDDGLSNWYTTGARTLPMADWNSICWDNIYNLFYIISSDNKFAYSDDGLNWNLLENIDDTNNWNKIYFANSLNNTYILQKNSNELLFSMRVDVAWNTLNLPIVSDWRDIAYKNEDKLLILVNGTNKICTIKEHSIFSVIEVGRDNWTNICYSEEKKLFVLISKDSNNIAYSDDGIVWDFAKLPYIDSWTTIIYDKYNFNKFFIFSNNNNKYLSSSDLNDWKIVDNELNQNYNITDAAVSNKMICTIFNDVDLSFKVMDGTDFIIDNVYQKTLTNIFNRNVTKSTFQIYFDKYDNFMYILYGNYKFKCNFKIDSSKFDDWYNITSVINHKKIEIYSNSNIIGNFNINNDIDIYNTSHNDNLNDIYYFIKENIDLEDDIYTFRIGNSIFNNNSNSLYGYVNDLILFNYVITRKEIDEISKFKILHCKFNYNFNDPIYNNIAHDISCYNHDFTGNANYSESENSLVFDNNKSMHMTKSNFNFNNDKFTLSFWYKNKIDNNIGSKILISNYENKKPYMLLLADQFKPTTNLPIQLVESRYEIKEFNLNLMQNEWVYNNGYYEYVVYNEIVTENTVIDILPSIYITDFEYDILIEACIFGVSQTYGSFVLRCYGIKPSIDIPIRLLTRNWVESDMALQYITLLADNWDNDLYNVDLEVGNTSTIEMIIDNSISDEEYSTILAADLRGYNQSNNSFTIKAHGVIPDINIPILFYINSTESKIADTILDRNLWVGNEKPYNYRIELQNSTNNFVNILPNDYITDIELDILKTAGLRDGGLFGSDMNGWMLTYMPTDKDPEKYSVYFVMIGNNSSITKVNCIKQDYNINFNNWNNFVITYKDGVFNTYVNGVPQNVENYKNYIKANNLIIGINQDMLNLINIGEITGQYYIKDVQIFHEHLNQNNIHEIYKKGNILNSSGDLYTNQIEEGHINVDISKDGLKVKTIEECVDNMGPNSEHDDLLINLQYGLNNNEVLLKGEIIEW